MRRSDDRGTDRLRLVEFPGKDNLVMPAELETLSDDELVALIIKRGGMDEDQAREALRITKGGRGRFVYDRV